MVQLLLRDAEPAPLVSRLHKLNRDSHRDLVENYDEVEAALTGTRHLALLRGTA